MLQDTVETLDEESIGTLRRKIKETLKDHRDKTLISIQVVYNNNDRMPHWCAFMHFRPKTLGI